MMATSDKKATTYLPLGCRPCFDARCQNCFLSDGAPLPSIWNNLRQRSAMSLMRRALCGLSNGKTVFDGASSTPPLNFPPSSLPEAGLLRQGHCPTWMGWTGSPFLAWALVFSQLSASALCLQLAHTSSHLPSATLSGTNNSKHNGQPEFEGKTHSLCLRKLTVHCKEWGQGTKAQRTNSISSFGGPYWSLRAPSSYPSFRWW